jgi:cyclopropane fatty-acyl-phospholipid synthase-like methyltransferase
VRRRAVYRYVDWRDQMRLDSSESLGFPPASLRFRVHGDLDLSSFLETGRQCSEDIRRALAHVGKDLGSFDNVLDFGCGCGRTLHSFIPSPDHVNFFGTDIDREAISWCRRSLAHARFTVNDQLPPLEYEDATFDLIYSISVFTHLTEDMQFRWLRELRRVAAPGAYLLLTVRGSSHPLLDQLPDADLQELASKGFVFSRTADRCLTNDLATHTEQYIRDRYPTYFKIVAYLERWLDGCQDIAVLSKQ